MILSLFYLVLHPRPRTKLAPPSPAAKIIQVSLDYRIHNGWSMDYQGLPIVDLLLSADPDAAAGIGESARRRRPTARSPAAARRSGRKRSARLHQRTARVLKKSSANGR